MSQSHQSGGGTGLCSAECSESCELNWRLQVWGEGVWSVFATLYVHCLSLLFSLGLALFLFFFLAIKKADISSAPFLFFAYDQKRNVPWWPDSQMCVLSEHCLLPSGGVVCSVKHSSLSSSLILLCFLTKGLGNVAVASYLFRTSAENLI